MSRSKSRLPRIMLPKHRTRKTRPRPKQVHPIPLLRNSKQRRPRPHARKRTPQTNTNFQRISQRNVNQIHIQL